MDAIASRTVLMAGMPYCVAIFFAMSLPRRTILISYLSSASLAAKSMSVSNGGGGAVTFFTISATNAVTPSFLRLLTPSSMCFALAAWRSTSAFLSTMPASVTAAPSFFAAKAMGAKE